MKETIIYGGAFYPPTRAHQAILQACVDCADQQRDADVWLLPSASRADKDITASIERRIELCDALRRDVMSRTVTIEICRQELDRHAPTETYDTVQELATDYPDRSFTWVFGSDAVATMRSWNQGQWLYDSLSMLVVSRPDAPPVALGARALWLQVETGDVSSTEVRRRMSAGEDYSMLVSGRVAALLDGAMV